MMDKTLLRPRESFTERTVLVLLLLVVSRAFAQHSNATLPQRLQQADGTPRPIMHTYFERIPMDRRFTDMSDEDEDELLDFWKASWDAAGWEPIVLGRDDAKRHPRYEQYEQELEALRLDDFGKIVLRRYLAMTTAGGWMCDYDAFPLRDFRNQGLGELPYKGKFALYGIVAATLAVADRDNWEMTLRALLDDAKQHVNKNAKQLNLWTDTSGMYALLRNGTVHVKSHRQVMPANFLMVQTPWSKFFCSKRQFRKPYLVVHFDAQSMLVGLAGVDHRLPRFRAATAREIVPHYATYCGINIVENES
jgi:hypothetical protein